MILYQREQTLRADKDLRVEIFRGPEDIRLRYSASASNEVLLVETLALTATPLYSTHRPEEIALVSWSGHYDCRETSILSPDCHTLRGE